MEETLYLLGSISASLLLLGHVGWLAAKWQLSARSRRQDRQLAAQFTRLQEDLSAQLEGIRGQLGSALEDVHDRLDFAERMLAQGREKPPEDK